jgi:hypothetical protein
MWEEGVKTFTGTLMRGREAGEEAIVRRRRRRRITR